MFPSRVWILLNSSLNPRRQSEAQLFGKLPWLMHCFLLNDQRRGESQSVSCSVCLTLCNTMDCSLPSSSVHGILQASILEWVAIPFSRESSQPRDGSQVSCVAGRLYHLSHQGIPCRGKQASKLYMLKNVCHTPKDKQNPFFHSSLFIWGLFIFLMKVIRDWGV